MARNFLANPFANYNGGFTSKPFPDGKRQALTVLAQIKWFTYQANGQSLGSANPDFNVIVNLNNAASNSVSLTWRMHSVYIDNDGCNFPVYVYFPDTQHTVQCPANMSAWFKVFTAARVAFVIGLNIPDQDIGNQVTTNVFFTDIESPPYLAPEIQSSVVQKLSSPVINIGGQGGQVTGIQTLYGGSGLTAGTLLISGGGGAGALASATINNLGQIDTLTLLSGGTGYISIPTVVATAPKNKIPNWDFNTAYAINSFVQFGAPGQPLTYWRAGVPIAANGAAPNINSDWIATGLLANQDPIFAATIGGATSGQTIINAGNFGFDALGDQVFSTVDTIAAAGIFHNNVFDTPAASGFIYLKSVFVTADLTATPNSCNWMLDNAAGGVVFNFVWNGLAKTVLDLQDCNIKLPANTTYRLRCTGITTNCPVTHNIVFTYSQF